MGDFSHMKLDSQELHPQDQDELDLNPLSSPNPRGLQKSLGALTLRQAEAKGKHKILLGRNGHTSALCLD